MSFAQPASKETTSRSYANTSPMSSSSGPEYYLGKVYTYGIGTELDPTHPNSRICKDLRSGLPPLDGALPFTWISRDGAVVSRDRVGNERRVMSIRPEHVSPFAHHSGANDGTPSYPSITLSDGRVIHPHMVAIEYDRQDPTATKLHATAQFFNRLPDDPPILCAEDQPESTSASPPPPKNFLMVKERILVHATRDEDRLKFEIVGTKSAITSSYTDTTGAPPPVYDLTATRDTHQNAEYLRDPITQLLYVWSRGFSDHLEMTTVVEHFIPEWSAVFSPRSVAPSDGWPPSYWA